MGIEKTNKVKRKLLFREGKNESTVLKTKESILFKLRNSSFVYNQYICIC